MQAKTFPIWKRGRDNIIERETDKHGDRQRQAVMIAEKVLIRIILRGKCKVFSQRMRVWVKIYFVICRKRVSA